MLPMQVWGPSEHSQSTEMQMLMKISPNVHDGFHITRMSNGTMRHCQRLSCACDNSTSGQQSNRYTEAAYVIQEQSVERAEWAEAVRAATSGGDSKDKKRVKQRFWQPKLEPPPLLDNVVVVLVSPRRPISVGTVARALSCFECSSLRIVSPRCDILQRTSKSASKGAQYLLHKAQMCESVQEAVADVDCSVAFTRWTRGRSEAFVDLPSLTSHPVIESLVQAPISPSSSTTRVALVFGREELGLSDEEVDACSSVCSIPIGRLQESLSLSHAVTLALSALYSSRLSHLAKKYPAYRVNSLEGLAEGYDSSEDR